MQAPPPPPGAQAHAHAPHSHPGMAQQTMSPYQPQGGFMAKKGNYSFEKWLMIGVILIVAATILTEIPNLLGEPSLADYADDELDKYAEDVLGHQSMIRFLGALGAMMQTSGLGLVSYAMIREAYDDDGYHTAIRVTAIICGILLLSNLASRGLSIL